MVNLLQCHPTIPCLTHMCVYEGATYHSFWDKNSFCAFFFVNIMFKFLTDTPYEIMVLAWYLSNY